MTDHTTPLLREAPRFLRVGAAGPSAMIDHFWFGFAFGFVLGASGPEARR